MTAVLVGFQYNSEKRLPGIVVDLFLGYSLAQKLGMKATILTDITTDTDAKQVNQLLARGGVDVSILGFISNRLCDKSLKPITSKNDLLKELKQLPTSSHLLFYYSGHGDDSGIILPNSERLDGTVLLESVGKCGAAESLWIMDCCGKCDLGLRYVWDGAWFVRNGKSKWRTDNLLLLRSVKGKVLATKAGSPFTATVVDVLKKEQIFTVTSLAKVLEPGLIYSTRPGNLFLYVWIFPKLQPMSKPIQLALKEWLIETSEEDEGTR